ncbi:hypothetical protein H7200_01820 [Candidatus Saccharibacteria bacterium]|nr:hypothetical protein [Candidatus Saccharibacteria bacterium]
MSSPEQQPQGPDTNVEAPKVSVEQYDAIGEKLKNGAELGAEKLESGEKKAEKARVEALESAVSVESGGAEKAKRPSEGPAARRKGGISKKERTASYKRHMAHVQAEMPAPQRAFSKLIHAPVIEKASEFIGSTIARPNAILSGAFVAFILVLAVYLVAKNFGYVLSGFETIAAFIVGWVIGILYDYFRVLITGKKS